MRGKVDLAHIPASRVRITPAYAGKRVFKIIGIKNNRDHPRVCGEKTKKIAL